MKKYFAGASGAALVLGVLVFAVAQPPGARTHRIIEKGELQPVPATSTPEIANEVSIEIVGDQRVITSNGIPNHKTGAFPNRGNPNRISAQSHVYHVPAKPKVADSTSPMHGRFGVAINGIPFDPGAAEFFAGANGHHWQYEPLSGAIGLGIDVSHAHVQPDGNYHYHGLPTGLLDSVKVDSKSHSPLIGWAADGFPIYAVYGYSDTKDPKSSIQKLASSYQLKKGDRPGGDDPAGTYDGTFVADYEFVAGSGDLDECNGRFTVTPDFPDGTYAYFLTENWPVIPRVYRGTPSSDFQHGGPGGLGGRGPSNRGPGGFAGSGPGGPGGPGGRGPGGRGPGGRNFGGRDFGGGPGGPPPKPGTILPPFLEESLNLSEQQREQLAALQKVVDDKLAEILTADQREQLEHPPQHGLQGPGFGGPDRRGGGPQGQRGPQGGPSQQRPPRDTKSRPQSE